MKSILQILSTWGGLIAFALVVLFVSATYMKSRMQSEELESVAASLKSANGSIEYARTSMGYLERQVGLLTTDLISRRVDEAVGRLDRIQRQLDSLQQIISPTNASEILTVAKMKEEIIARDKFEKRIEQTALSVDQKLSSLQLALVGLAGAVIAALLGFLWLLLTRVSSLYAQVQAIQGSVGAGPKAGTNAA